MLFIFMCVGGGGVNGIPKSIEITPALHPIPDRLYDKMSGLILNSLMAMEQRDGVGENNEQLIIRISISYYLLFIQTPCVALDDICGIDIYVGSNLR